METTATAIHPHTASSKSPAVLKLTERALMQLKEIMQAQGMEGHVLTVRVTPSGCSGFGYDLNLSRETRAGDVVWEQEGVRIATDEMSRQYLMGTEVDYVSGLQGAGFKFVNPNAKSSCGCGNSFSA
jgi:iron-sulfur cluster assembly protein